MANITNEQWQVLINIIGAVETGNQIYGQRDYADYTEAYANSSAENSLTIGAFQEFGVLAKGLLNDIKNKYPAIFAKYDNAGIAQDLQKSSWVGYSPSKTSDKAKAIVNIINSPEGRKIQDERFITQMKEHVALGEKLGVTDVDALFEICNISHQGGTGAVKRVIAKTSRPYTLDHIYQALCTDNVPNQVGTFVNRQRLVYQWLKQYMPKSPNTSSQETSTGTTADDILNIMRSWIGLNGYDGSHMQIVNIYNSHRPLARNYQLTAQDSWCACTVSTAFIKANATDLIGGTECGVERFIEDCFKPKNIWIEDGTITPLSGDIICFNWDTSYQPNNGFADHIGIVEYVENGVIHTIEGNASNRVQRRTYSVGDGNIRGYARPKYGSDSTTAQPSTAALDPVPAPTNQTVQPNPQAQSTASTGAYTGAPSKERKFYGKVVADVLNIRTYAGTQYPRLKSYPQLVYGTVVEVCDTVNDNQGNPWYYIRINNSIYGFAFAQYIQKQ